MTVDEVILTDLTFDEVRDFVTAPFSVADERQINARLRAMSALLQARYGTIRKAHAPVVLSIMGAAISRRLAKRNQMARSEGAGPFRVDWDAASTRATFFLPEELAELDDLMGLGGARTYRTPAPDGVRYASRMVPLDVDGWED